MPKPAEPASSITLRTGCPTSEGTATFLPAFTITDPFTTGAGGGLAGIDDVDASASGGFGVIVSANAVVESTGRGAGPVVAAVIWVGAASFAIGAACTGLCCGARNGSSAGRSLTSAKS